MLFTLLSIHVSACCYLCLLMLSLYLLYMPVSVPVACCMLCLPVVCCCLCLMSLLPVSCICGCCLLDVVFICCALLSLLVVSVACFMYMCRFPARCCLCLLSAIVALLVVYAWCLCLLSVCAECSGGYLKKHYWTDSPGHACAEASRRIYKRRTRKFSKIIWLVRTTSFGCWTSSFQFQSCFLYF